MAYGTPMQNQNKGYAAQEKKDLLGDMPIDKVASGGSWMSKHISSPLAMGKAHSMAPKMESPAELTAEGKKKIMASDANPAFKKAIEASPAEMHGSALHKYDDVVLGGNEGDKSKTKPGKKDFK